MSDNVVDKKRVDEVMTGNERYRALFDSAKLGIVYLDSKGMVVDVNQAFVLLAGYSREEIMNGIFPGSLCAGKTREMLDEFLRAVFENNRTEPVQCEMTPRTGGPVEMEVDGIPVYDEHGEATGAWMVFRDVTSQNAAQKLLKAVNYLAERSMNSQNLEEILKAGVLAILEATGLDSGMAGFLTEDGKHFTLAYSHGLSDEFVTTAEAVVSSDERYRGVQESGPIYAQYDDVSLSRNEVFSREGIRAVAIMPILEDGELIGGVNLSSHTMEEIPQESRYIIEALVNQMAREVSRHRLLLAYKGGEELYRALIESSPDAVLVRDLDDNIIMASPAAVEMHGYDSEEEMTGKNILELVAGEDIDNVRKTIAQVKEEGSVIRKVFGIVRKDDSRIIVEASGSLIRDINGEPKAILTTTRDITDRIMTEERLKRINAELKGYAHTVSHDLRGPVANIILGTDVVDRIMEDFPDNEEFKDLIEVIDSIGDHARKTLRLIQELLDLAEAGQVPLNKVEVDVHETIEGIVSELSHNIEEKRVRIEVDDELGKIHANSTQIYQLFSNLIQNAIRHNDKDDLVVEIRHLSPPGSKWQKYLVRDNGSGIPEELTASIFDPFARTGKLKPGIGLSIVDKIVKAYDGEIKYYYQDGACFEIAFPNA